MSKAQAIKFALAILAAVVPVVVSTFPALPPILVAILSALAAYSGGTALHNAPSPKA